MDNKVLKFLKYIKNIPRNWNLKREYRNIVSGNIAFEKNGLNKKMRNIPEIIVSLTSYPGRINIVPGTIASLLSQTFKPDRIILWLGEEKFPNKKLPLIYKKIRSCGVEIKFREDLKSHTKYFYVMKENPESIVITVDDDMIYHKNMIKQLVNSYIKYPFLISAIRVHKIRFDEQGEILPYNEWNYEFFKKQGSSSHQYFATGVGGVLYPPHSLHSEVFNLEIIKKYCHNHDDLWLKIMAVMADTRVVMAADSKRSYSHHIYNSQESGQYIENVCQGGNDRQTKAVISIYNHFFNNDTTLCEIMLKG